MITEMPLKMKGKKTHFRAFAFPQVQQTVCIELPYCQVIVFVGFNSLHGFGRISVAVFA
jgi:hypothetical protein